jgi:hypothetical protein
MIHMNKQKGEFAAHKICMFSIANVPRKNLTFLSDKWRYPKFAPVKTLLKHNSCFVKVTAGTKILLHLQVTYRSFHSCEVLSMAQPVNTQSVSRNNSHFTATSFPKTSLKSIHTQDGLVVTYYRAYSYA